MFAWLLIACLTVYLFLYWWLWRVWNLTYIVSQKLYYFRYSYWSLISVLLFCITLSCIAWRTITWCVNTYHAVTWHLHAISWYVISWHLPDIIWHRHVITRHLSCLILDSYNYHKMGMMTWHLDFILIYSSTIHTPDTTCTYDIPDMLLLIPIHW